MPQAKPKPPSPAGAIYMHRATGEAFICAGRLVPVEGALSALLLTRPVLFGGNASSAIPERECVELEPPLPLPPPPPARVWRRTTKAERPAGYFLIEAAR